MDRLIQEINAPEIDPEKRPSAEDMLEFLAGIGCIERVGMIDGTEMMRVTKLGIYTHDYLCQTIALVRITGQTAEEIEAQVQAEQN